MLINHWYVLGESAELGDRPLGTRALGQDFVLFRDGDGRARCLSDVCVHKGGSLCRGEVVRGAVQCPYHGWRFDGAGDCVGIPSLGDARLPARARVDAYPVVEKWGFIWVFLGDLSEAERPPVPDFFPEFEADDGQWRFVRGRYVFDCNWVRAIENGVDRTHAVFVHTDFGNPQNPVVPEYHVEDDNHRLYGFTLRKPLNKRGAWRDVIPDERDERKTEVQIFVPAPCIRIQMHMQPPVSQIIVTAYTPLDPYRTQLRFIHARNFMMDGQHDEDTLKRVYFVLQEDAAVINHLRPAEVPPLASDELLLANDRHGMAYRRKVQEAAARGLCIDHRSQLEDDRVRVIPCPRRREDPKNWVHRTVRLKDGPDAGADEADEADEADGS